MNNKRLSNLFIREKKWKPIMVRHPKYFDLDFCHKLEKIIGAMKLGFDNSWYEAFQKKFILKTNLLNQRSYKILILNGIKGDYSESLLTFLVNFKSKFDILKFVKCRGFDNIFSMLTNFYKHTNRKINLKILAYNKNIDYNSYDFIISLGPTKLLLDLLKEYDGDSKIVFIDFGFSHAIEEDKNIFLKNLLASKRKLYLYSCQKYNLDTYVSNFLNNIKAKYFPYIPCDIKRFPFIKNSDFLFDIVILGVNRRNFSILVNQSEYFKEKKILFLSGDKYAEEIERVKDKLNIKIIPAAVDKEYYLKFLSVSKIVFIPWWDNDKDVYVSISEALAMGKVVVTSLTPGISQILEQKKYNSPLIAVRNDDPAKLKNEIDHLLNDDNYRKIYEKRALNFARKELNIDLIYFKIFKDLFNVGLRNVI